MRIVLYVKLLIPNLFFYLTHKVILASFALNTLLRIYISVFMAFLAHGLVNKDM